MNRKTLLAVVLCVLIPMPMLSSSWEQSSLMKWEDRFVLEDENILLRFQDDCATKGSSGPASKLCVYERDGYTVTLKKEMVMPPSDFGYVFNSRFDDGRRDLVVANGRWDFIIVDLKAFKLYGPFQPYTEGLEDAPDASITFTGFEADGALLVGTSFNARRFAYDVRDLTRVREIFSLQGGFEEPMPGEDPKASSYDQHLMVFEDFDSPGYFFGIKIWQTGEIFRGNRPSWGHTKVFEKKKLKQTAREYKISGVICGDSVSAPKCKAEEQIPTMLIGKDYNHFVSQAISGIFYPGGSLSGSFELTGFAHEGFPFTERAPNAMRAVIKGEADLKQGTFTAVCHTSGLVVESPGADRFRGTPYVVFTEELPEGKERYLAMDFAENNLFELDKTGAIKDLLVEHILKQADRATNIRYASREGELLLKAVMLDPKNQTIRERLSKVGIYPPDEKKE